jgi:REP element-mobilizing transposase RayT
MSEDAAMTRAPRREFPNGLYHVTNRGLERRAIVSDDEDRWSWFRLLGRVATRFQWRVFAYVLLDNHFHLFFRIREANLSDGMHDLESAYATGFNQRQQRVGPLFQGRFKSVLVENESHAGELTRYLHLNPVRAGLAADPLAYAWSSYRWYLNPRGAPAWLDWNTVLSEIGGTEAAARLGYKRFVDAALRQPPRNPLEDVVDGWLLGSPEFIERRRLAVADSEAPTAAPAHCTAHVVIRAVAGVWGVTESQIQRCGRHINLPREAAILLARELTCESLTATAEVFGVGGSAISETVRRARQRVVRDAHFRASIDRIRQDLLR